MQRHCKCKCALRNQHIVNTGPSFPLALAAVGEYVRVAAIRGGVNCKERLFSIGIHVEDVVQIIQSRPNGAVLIAKGENRLMLGGGMAQKIFVIKE